MRALVLLSLTACVHAAALKPTDRRVTSGDAVLHVRAVGHGPETLVLIHGGWGISSEYMSGLEALAGPALRVVSYDQRGVGKSTGTVATTDVMAQATGDLEAIRVALGVEKMHLLGHSAGGLNALSYAIAHPEHVASLILVESVPLTHAELAVAVEHFSARMAKLVEDKVITRDEKEPDPTLRLLAKMPVYFVNPRHPSARSLGGARMFPVPGNAMHKGVVGYDIRAAAAALRLNVFVYFSAVPFGAAMGDSAAKGLTGSLVLRMSQSTCGHLPWVECPDDFLPAVEAFLQGVDR